MSLKSRAAAVLQPVLFFGALLLLWEYGVVWFRVKPYLLPRLSAVILAGWRARDQLAQNAIVTAEDVVIGFVSAVLGGLLLGAVIYFWGPARRTVYPLVTALQTTPKSALAPLMIVWFGYGLVSKVAMAFLFAFFPIVIATLGGFAGTPANLTEHFLALQANRWQTFVRLRLPSALPVFVDGCKVAMPLAVIGAIIGEFVGSQDGLGYFILLATSAAHTDLVFATILAVSLLSLVFYAVIEIAGRWVWWRGLPA